MPKNTDKDILNKFNSIYASPDIKASLQVSKKSFEYKNGLYKILYGQPQASTAAEKILVINEFFADLFDVSNLEWNIRSAANQPLKQLATFLTKYLKKADFEAITWITKFRAGTQGRYALVLVKHETGKIVNGEPETLVNLIPARIAFKNTINCNVISIEVIYDDLPLSDSTGSFLLKKKFSLSNNAVAVDNTLINQSDEKNVIWELISDEVKNNVPEFDIKKLNYNFIPVCILTNDYDERPRMSKVASRLMMINRYDEIQAILPHWEKGALGLESNSITSHTENENYNFITKFLMDGLVQISNLNMDGNQVSIADRLTGINPTSIMQTLRNTRNDIYNEIKSDLGIPNIDDIKSAQQTTAEIVAQQFLTSPIIERETIFMKKFLIDLAYKFLKILKTCNILDKFPEIDLDTITIDVELKINTSKNVASVLKNANNSQTKKAGENDAIQ